MDRSAKLNKNSEMRHSGNQQKGNNLSLYRAKHQFFKSEANNCLDPMRQRSETLKARDTITQMFKEKPNRTKRLSELSFYGDKDNSKMMTKDSSFFMRQSSRSKSKSIEKEARKTQRSFQSQLEADAENYELSKERSNEKLKQDSLSQTLTNYTRFLKDRHQDNHSPKRDQIPGSSPPPKDPLQTLCTTISHFKSLEPSGDGDDKSKKPVEIHAPLKLPYAEMFKAQTAREKAKFLEFYPQFKTKVSPKSKEALFQRKRNMKILEDLFIRKGNRATRKIYQSIS